MISAEAVTFSIQAEHQRLKDAVVEAAKIWKLNQFKWAAPDFIADLDKAVEALLAFESKTE